MLPTHPLSCPQTELCRNWEKEGSCPYGVKCQFAHGMDDLRAAGHHPRFRTEFCRSFAVNGTCRFGPRCRFVHVAPGAGLEQLLEQEQLQQLQQMQQQLQQQQQQLGSGLSAGVMIGGQDLASVQQVRRFLPSYVKRRSCYQ